MFGSKKRKIPCKFCDKTAEYLKVYNDFFCVNCQRFQSEVSPKEIRTLQIFKLKNYLFAAQKYTYIIYNELGSKIAYAEKRDITKFVSDKNFGIRYYFYNDLNSIIGSLDCKPIRLLNTNDGLWKIYDIGRNICGEIRHLSESDTWQILTPENQIIALRDPKDSRTLQETMRQFTIIDANDSEHMLFQVNRKNGFQIKIFDQDFETLITWGFVIALHQKYYS
ncbi:MAG: hypothetical protein EAX90_04990 [Candidatus Heimdallarchaeota archaeon]|nr:hypothetical protein [Candidatus Heimdallarchaeota archaeon]